MASTIDSLLMRPLPMPGSISVIAHHIISRTMLRGFCLFCLGAVVSIQPVLSCDVNDDTDFPRFLAALMPALSRISLRLRTSELRATQ